MGWLAVSADYAWLLFLRTGLPEAYTVYCLLREEERREECSA